jgi:hypothetical protein
LVGRRGSVGERVSPGEHELLGCCRG